MNVIGAGVAAAKELVSRDTPIAAVDVPCPLQWYDVFESRDSRRVASQDVENRFGAKPGHSRASDMFETYWKGTTRFGQTSGLSEK